MANKFNNLHEALAAANEVGISIAAIANSMGMSRQNFNNKLNRHGSKFTSVHLLAIDNYLAEAFAAVHEKVSIYLDKPASSVHELVSSVHEVVVPKVVSPVHGLNVNGIDRVALQKEWDELQIRKREHPEEFTDELDENYLPF